MPRLLPALALFAAALLPASLVAAPVVKTEHVEAELVASHAAAQPGKAALVGLRLRMEPEWHTYWKNPGDSGLPTRIQWILPEGWKAGEIQWPHPKRLPIGPLMNFGYEDEVVLLAELTPPASAPAGSAPIKAKAEWLVCKDVCIPEKGELDMVLAVAAGDPPANPKWKSSIERAQLALPVTLPGWKFESAVHGKTLSVRITPPAGVTPPTKLAFFPERENLIENAAPQKAYRDGAGVRIDMKLADPVVTGLQSVSGVAVADGAWPGAERRKALAVAAPIAALPPPAAAATSDETIGGSVLLALVFAFLGGVLLNAMPCVFPVLGIKVMGFVEHAHGNPRAMRVQGLVYASGVILSFLVLAGVMLGLRAAGTQLGWGFQLQSPAFVTLLAALFFVLALNLSGVFEWGAFAQSMTSDLSARGRYADAFLSGVLATVVATPCTAPFMGSAVGFTLSQPAAAALAVFVILGVGMALPVVLLASFPSLLKRIPKPGPWMETFKQVLAFPLYATVAWLVWIVGGQAGNNAVLALLAGLVLIAMGAWMYGRWNHASGIWRPATAIALAALGLFVAWPGPTASTSAPKAAAAKAGELPWQEWSPEKVANLGARGVPVFIDFTADWCVTCQVNKRMALNNDEVIKSFAARGIVPLRADWTRQDPRIADTLSQLGRNAIPVYALYTPGEPAPKLLPEVLTPAIVLHAVSHLPANAPSTIATRP